MDLPPNLIEAVRMGRAILFLGAGASLQAKSPDGKTALTSTELARDLAKTFLGGKYPDAPLATISQYAIDHASLREVEFRVRDLYEPLEPTPAHERMTSFVWRGLATTNYDRIVEKAYERPGAAQRLFPIRSNKDRIEPEAQLPTSVIYLKLHGCVSYVPDASCPLILTHEQYLEHQKSRDKLFSSLETWAYDYPIIFVGSSITDSDLRQVISQVSRLPEGRPTYYLISPDIDELQTHSWAQRRIVSIKGTFTQFISALEKEIPKKSRSGLQKHLSLEHPVAKRFSVPNAECTQELLTYLEAHAEYVAAIDAIPILSATDYFRGLNPRWSAVEKLFDIERELYEPIMAEVFLRDSAEHRSTTEIFVITGAAGSGKSTLLQRLAWDASRDFEKLCLFLKEEGLLLPEPIIELAEKTKESIYIFIDNASEKVGAIVRFLDRTKSVGRQLTIIAAERTSEWNVSSSPVDNHVLQEYEINPLTNKEIDRLIQMLTATKSLGNLTGLTRDEIHEAFRKRAWRQLLVALYELTYGRPFEDIVEDEYHGLHPVEAQSLYLTICVMNRFNVPVRAGAIARIHNLPFEEFKNRFFRPLEHVVYTSIDHNTGDHWYKARHPVIAEIVFIRILASQEQRFDQYVRCLTGMNPLYASDRNIMRSLLHARTLLELFPNHDLVARIFATAHNLFAADSYVHQQEAIYEMNRPNGSLKQSLKLLTKASELSPRDLSIKHSKAELQLKLADSVPSRLQRESHLRQAERIALELKTARLDSHPFHTLAKVNLRRLADVLSDADHGQDAYERVITATEESLSDGLLRYPDDPYLKEAEAQLADMLKDSARALKALETSFARNPRSPFVAKRLSKIYELSGRLAESRQVLTKALEANPGSAPLHFAYANYIMRNVNRAEDANREELLFHLRRSFSPGDDNRDAQVLYARELLLSGDQPQAERMFEVISSNKKGGSGRNLRLWPLPDRQKGYIRKLSSSYVFVSWDKSKNWVYAAQADSDGEHWKKLRLNAHVNFVLAFNLQGPVAMDVRSG